MPVSTLQNVRSRRFHVLVALVALVALLAAACGGSEDATTSATNATGTESAGGAQAGVVLPTTDGGQLAFNDLEGKPALLWFWAPW